MTLGIRRIVLALVILGSVAAGATGHFLVGEVQSAYACDPTVDPVC